jgi:uncharacterized protein YwqG
LTVQPPLDLKPLLQLIEQQGLSDYQDALLERVRPAIYIQLGQAGLGQTGQSKIGGLPDLPPSIPWPSDAASQKSLCFILQINLAELPVTTANPLPTQGMLYLFVNDGHDNPEQVIFYTGNETLHPREQPTELIADWYDDLVPHTLVFTLGADLPRWATNQFYTLSEQLEREEDSLDDLVRDLSEDSIGKLFGYAAGIGHDPSEDAYVVREVNPAWLYEYDQRSQLDMAAAEHWQSLLTLESDFDIDLVWGDAGYLLVLIRDTDLEQLDFSRVYVDLESS